MSRVVITRGIIGVCYMGVCAVLDATDAEILAVCNAENPSGTELGWTTVVRSADGPQAPVVCQSDPTRVHLLVGC